MKRKKTPRKKNRERIANTKIINLGSDDSKKINVWRSNGTTLTGIAVMLGIFTSAFAVFILPDMLFQKSELLSGQASDWYNTMGHLAEILTFNMFLSGVLVFIFLYSIKNILLHKLENKLALKYGWDGKTDYKFKFK